MILEWTVMVLVMLSVLRHLGKHLRIELYT
jgi:hypothetical protein